MKSSTSRVRQAATLALVVALLASACSTAVDPAPHESNSGEFPVTIQTAMGTTIIPAKPKRVITLIDDEFVVALGITPIALSRGFMTESGLSSTVEPYLIGADFELLDVAGGNPYEQIAALSPDLIVGGVTQQDYDQLARIAPTLPYVGDTTTDTWQERQLTVGIALGLEQEAEELIQKTDERIATLRAGSTELDGKSFSLSLAFEPGLVSVLRSTSEPAVNLLGDLGLSLAERSQQLTATDLSGRSSINLESLDALDADLIFLAGFDQTLVDEVLASPSFTEIIDSRRVVVLPIELVLSLVRPSAISAHTTLERVLSEINE